MARRGRQTREMAVYVGIKGAVVALDRASGEELWRAPLKGAGFVTVALDAGLLLASTRGEVWCLEPWTGRMLWHNPLRGLGFGMATLAGANSTPASMAAAAAEFQQQQSNAATAATVAGTAAV